MATEQAKKTAAIQPTGLICPRDPNRGSTDLANPPTHLSSSVGNVYTPDEKNAPNRKRADIVCNTCGAQWTVDWPIQPGRAVPQSVTA